MAEQRKRRASKQLSPYDVDKIEEEPAEVKTEVNELPKDFKKARMKRGGEIENSEKLKGIFGKSILQTMAGKEGTAMNSNKKESIAMNSDKKEGGDVIAGINKSFLSAINKVINKQANKNLIYLFKQYEAFIEEANKKTKK